ncbi:glycosyltransferase family 39 protein, partial [Vicingaceae bacterium]|nr:glycosyltransferase family 39 protein [Vicingaceae bacterium]
MERKIVKSLATHLLVILALSATVMFTCLGNARLWDRDEPRNAGCAAEMMARGDLVVPIFNDELRHQKPALLYWLIISAYKIFGVTEFAARFWSAVLAIGSVVSTYFIARRLASPTVGLLAAVILSTSLMFDVAGRAATPDSVLIFCGTLAMLIYVLGTFSPKQNENAAPSLRSEGHWFPQNILVVIAMFGVMGLGVLAKGPVGLIVPTAIIGMFLLLKRLKPRAPEIVATNGRFGNLLINCFRPFQPAHFFATCWYMRPITAIVTVLVVAAPWYIAVGLRTDGDFLQMFFLTEHFGRATTTFENHSGGFWYYPVAIILGFFPWSAFFLPIAISTDRRISRNDNWSTIYIFCLCWIAVQVGIFSVAQTKLPSYVTPCYPALAILASCCLYQIATQSSLVPAFFIKAAFGALSLSGIGITVGLIIALNKFFPDTMWLAVIGIIPLVGGAVCFWQFSR